MCRCPFPTLISLLAKSFVKSGSLEYNEEVQPGCHDSGVRHTRCVPLAASSRNEFALLLDPKPPRGLWIRKLSSSTEITLPMPAHCQKMDRVPKLYLSKVSEGGIVVVNVDSRISFQIPLATVFPYPLRNNNHHG